MAFCVVRAHYCFEEFEQAGFGQLFGGAPRHLRSHHGVSQSEISGDGKHIGDATIGCGHTAAAEVVAAISRRETQGIGAYEALGERFQ